MHPGFNQWESASRLERIASKQTHIFQDDGLSTIFVSKKTNITFEIASLIAELKERFIRTFIRLWENVIPPLPYRKLHTYPPLHRLIQCNANFQLRAKFWLKGGVGGSSSKKLVPAPWVFLPFSPILLLVFASFLHISLVKPQISIPYCQVRPYWIPRAFGATLEKRDMRAWLYTENKIVSSTTLDEPEYIVKTAKVSQRTS